MIFVNFPVDKFKRTFLLLVQRAEHVKETCIADKKNTCSEMCFWCTGPSHARFVSLCA